MQGYKFLNKNEVLNKQNLKVKINELIKKSNKGVSNNDTEVKKKLIDLDKKMKF